MQIKLCKDCEVYPAETGNGVVCSQCLYGVAKAVDGEKPLTKAEEAHLALSRLVANGHCTGKEALEAWDKFKNRPRPKFFGKRKAEAETPEEKHIRLALIAEETRKLYPKQFGS